MSEESKTETLNSLNTAEHVAELINDGNYEAAIHHLSTQVVREGRGNERKAGVDECLRDMLPMGFQNPGLWGRIQRCRWVNYGNAGDVYLIRILTDFTGEEAYNRWKQDWETHHHDVPFNRVRLAKSLERLKTIQPPGVSDIVLYSIETVREFMIRQDYVFTESDKSSLFYEMSEFE